MKRMVLAAILWAALASMATAAPPAPPQPANLGGVRAGSTYSYPYGAYPYRGPSNYAPGSSYRQPGTLRYYEGAVHPASKYPLGGPVQADYGAAGYWYW